MQDQIKEALKNMDNKQAITLAQSILNSTPREKWDENLKLMDSIINGLLVTHSAMKAFFDFATQKSLSPATFWQIDLQFETMLDYCERANEHYHDPETKQLYVRPHIITAFVNGAGDWTEARDNLARIGWLDGHPEMQRGEFIPTFADECFGEDQS